MSRQLDNRRILVAELRSGPLDWNFGWHTTCAIGLAHRLGIVIWPASSYDLAKAIGIKASAGSDLFAPYDPKKIYGVTTSYVTPDMVADKIEQFCEQVFDD